MLLIKLRNFLVSYKSQYTHKCSTIWREEVEILIFPFSSGCLALTASRKIKSNFLKLTIAFVFGWFLMNQLDFCFSRDK